MLAFSAVVDPGGFHLDHPGTGRDLSFFGVAVADDQAFAGAVELVGVGVQVGLALDQQRRLSISWAARRHSSSRPIVVGACSTRPGVSCTSFNIGVLLPAGVTRQARCWFNLEGTSLP